MSISRLHDVSSDEVMAHLRPLVDALGRLDEVQEVILFGSLARRQMTEASDVDLAIIVRDEANPRQVREQARRLKKDLLPWPCDLVVLPCSWFLRRRSFGGLCMEIDQNGIRLYRRSKPGEPS